MLYPDPSGNVMYIHIVGEAEDDSDEDFETRAVNSFSLEPPVAAWEKRRRMRDYWQNTVKPSHKPARSAT
jgi:hypothetical protein